MHSFGFAHKPLAQTIEVLKDKIIPVGNAQFLIQNKEYKNQKYIYIFKNRYEKAVKKQEIV